MNDLKTFGFLFENMCIRDLRIYADKIGGNVYHYRGKNNLEVDCVIYLKNGSYELKEIKLFIAEGAKKLLKLTDKIDRSKMKNTSFMMVLTGTKYEYKREDGVLVVPITCLKD